VYVVAVATTVDVTTVVDVMVEPGIVMVVGGGLEGYDPLTIVSGCRLLTSIHPL
jgi:hypothetical protein